MMASKSPQLLIFLHAANHGVLADKSSFPVNRHVDVFSSPLSSRHNFVDEMACDLLAVRGGCFWSVPQARQISRQGLDTLALLRRQSARCFSLEAIRVFLQLALLTESLFPLLLQRTGHHRISGSTLR